MNLLQRMRVWRELKRLEHRVRTEPAPNTFVDLGQVHINLDMHDKAERIAEDGLALFPRSTELRQLLECARRGGRRKRANELKAKLVRAPSPKLYEDLAALQVEINDRAGLQQTCHEWSLRFPGDPGSWHALAQAHLVNFYRDLSAREGVEAVRCLDRALHLQPDDKRGLRLFGELLYRIGAVRLAEARVQRLLRLDPADAGAATLLRHLGDLEDMGDDVALLLDDVQRAGALRHPAPSTGPRAPDQSLAGVREGLTAVASIKGVTKAAFIRGSKALVKGDIRDGRDAFLRVARVVAKAAQRFSRRLDLGTANKTVVEGPFGVVCVCVYGDSLAVAQCVAGSDVDQVLVELQEIVAGALAGAAR
jgi:tetratricopeptide (TPR) repeat protein